MSGLAMLALAAALFAWPSMVPADGSARPAAVVTAATGAAPVAAGTAMRLRRRLDHSMPVLLAGGVLVLVAVLLGGSGGIVAGAGCAAITLVVLRRARSRAAESSGARVEQLPLLLAVASLLLRSGSPAASAMRAAAGLLPGSGMAPVRRVAAMIGVGQSPERAWSGLLTDDVLRPVAQAAIRSSHSGATLAEAWAAIAEQSRAQRRLAAEIRARKVGVTALAPLGLCFLPSFICLGVVPVVIGLAGDILG